MGVAAGLAVLSGLKMRTDVKQLALDLPALWTMVAMIFISLFWKSTGHPVVCFRKCLLPLTHQQFPPVVPSKYILNQASFNHISCPLCGPGFLPPPAESPGLHGGLLDSAFLWGNWRVPF